MPANIERPVFRKKVEAGIRQALVNPACEVLPAACQMIGVPIARHDDAGGGTHKSIGIAPVPDMLGVVGFIGGTRIASFACALHLVAEPIDLARPVG